MEEDIRFEEVRYLPKRESWFRLPEREKTKTDILRLNEGSWIETDRIIVRAGYYYQPMDMPMDLLRERARKHVINFMNRGMALVGDFQPLYDGDIEGDFDYLDMDRLMDALFTSEDSMLKGLYYKLRGIWGREMRAELFKEDKAQAYLKTFYYVNIDKRSYQIDTIKMKHCGTWNSSFGGYYGDDYDPPFLSTSVYQHLYYVGTILNQDRPESVYVHPLDCYDLNKENYK